VDVCGNPSLTPTLCDKVEEILGVAKGMLFVYDCTVDIGDDTRRIWAFFRVFM